MSGSNQAELRRMIIKHSISKTWEEAKFEWKLLVIYDQNNSCVCGHDIIENCEIENINNGHKLVVGNKCIEHFQMDDLRASEKARTSLKKLKRDPSNYSANQSLIDLSQRLGFITESTARFYKSITSGHGAKKHFDPHHEYFSKKKYKCREDINFKLLNAFKPSIKLF